MSGQDLYIEMGDQIALLDKALKQIGTRGRQYAQAEQDYRVALAKKILAERDDGAPVTIIGDVCRGCPSVAKLKFDRDVAESVYKAALEACNVYKLKIKVLEAQIDREYRG